MILGRHGEDTSEIGMGNWNFDVGMNFESLGEKEGGSGELVMVPFLDISEITDRLIETEEIEFDGFLSKAKQG